MLSTESRPYIDASVPVLREHGLAITKRFYQNLFAAHPQLHNLFNAGNQANGSQQQSLASAVFAYAANIDNQAALTPVISRIVHKHASLGVTAAHYPIVGEHLLRAIKEVLGDAATPELIAAWAEAYGLLAQALMDEENRLYQAAGIQAGDLFAMRVVAVNNESEQVRSFTLIPVDGVLPGFRPGQYVSVAITLPSGLRQLRQYSLSDAPNGRHLRISVKREIAGQETPAGMVSNWLHDNLATGSVVEVSKPFGDFQPDTESDKPVVLLSAGVGITPMISALNRIADVAPQRRVIFAHAARNEKHHAHQDDIALAAAKMPNLQTVFFYEEPSAGKSSKAYLNGRMVIDKLPQWDVDQADVYMCGPLPFMQEQWAALVKRGVPATHLHREVFGPDMLDHLI
jgi:nitric oxide dioxygenase